MLGLIGSREAVVHWCCSYVINLHIWNAKRAIDSRQACGIARKSGTTMTKVTCSAGAWDKDQNCCIRMVHQIAKIGVTWMSKSKSNNRTAIELQISVTDSSL
jgi:hypothetical protein